MKIVQAVYQNDIENDIALVTEIGYIPFVNEGEEKNQQLIDAFNSGFHNLDNGLQVWSVLDDDEKTDFYDVSLDYWL